MEQSSMSSSTTSSLIANRKESYSRSGSPSSDSPTMTARSALVLHRATRQSGKYVGRLSRWWRCRSRPIEVLRFVTLPGQCRRSREASGHRSCRAWKADPPTGTNGTFPLGNQLGDHGVCGRSPLTLRHGARAAAQRRGSASDKGKGYRCPDGGDGEVYLVRFSLSGPPGPPPGPPSILMFNVISSPLTEPSCTIFISPSPPSKLMANETLSPSTLPSLICNGCPPGPSAVPVNFVPSCLKVNVIDMPPPSGPLISPLHFPVTSAARTRPVVSANRMAHLMIVDLFMRQKPLGSRYHRIFDSRYHRIFDWTVKLCKSRRLSCQP